MHQLCLKDDMPLLTQADFRLLAARQLALQHNHPVAFQEHSLAMLHLNSMAAEVERQQIAAAMLAGDMWQQPADLMAALGTLMQCGAALCCCWSESWGDDPPMVQQQYLPSDAGHPGSSQGQLQAEQVLVLAEGVPLPEGGPQLEQGPLSGGSPLYGACM